MWRYAAFRIGERIDPNEPRRRNDLAIDCATPHELPVRGLDAVVRQAAGPEVHFHQVRDKTLWPEPPAEVRGLGPHLPHCLAGGVELAADDKRRALQPGQVFGQALQGLLSALD